MASDPTPTPFPDDAKTRSGNASLARHYMHYLNANILGVLAGFVSFPVMVRLLSEKEFGIFGYFDTMALLWIAILKLGIQQSLVRFYPSHCHGKPLADRRRFYASLLLAPAAVSVVLCLLSLGGLLLYHNVREVNLLGYLVIVIVLGQLGVLVSFAENVMRARELSGRAAIVSVCSRWLQVVLMVLILYYVSRTAMGVYAARIAASVGMLGWMGWWLMRNCDLHPRSYDPKLFREGLAFGLPLIGSEIAMILLAFADQLMIKEMLGKDNSDFGFSEVGVYRVGYGLATYVGIFLQTSLFAAFTPVANRLYETKGAETVQKLKHDMVRMLLYVAVALVVGLMAVGSDFLMLLAGPGKERSVPVFQWVGVSYALQPLIGVMAYGLILLKRTRVITSIMFVATGFNIMLNLFLIPRFGIMGSVYATLASYILMGVMQMAACPARLSTIPTLDVLARPLLLGAILFGVYKATNLFDVVNPIGRLAMMSGLAGALFFLPALLIDRRLREYVNENFGSRLWRWK